MKKFVVNAVMFLFFSISLLAQDGVLDPGFGSNGNGRITLVGGSTNLEGLQSVLIQPDGKIIIGGYVDQDLANTQRRMYIARLNKDGKSFDTGFNGGSARIIAQDMYSDVQGMALMSDGSILYGGTLGNPGGGTLLGATLGRLSSSGLPATDIYSPVGPFYADLITVDQPITSLSYNPINNKAVLGGYVNYSGGGGYNYNMEAYKFDVSNGSFVNGFGNSGSVSSNKIGSVKSVVHLADGSVLELGIKSSAGANYSVAKINADGTFDTNFGTSGGVSFNSLSPSVYGAPEDMVVLPNGQIWICGSVSSKMAIMRINANGTNGMVDTTSFIYTGGFLFNTFTSMVVQQDSKVIVCGSLGGYGTSAGIIVRYNEDGSLDSTFGTNGSIEVPSTALYSAAISYSDSTVVFAGQNVTSYTSSNLGVVKIKYVPKRKIEYNILGKDIVSVDTKSTFKINPVVPGHSYQWSYSSNDIYTLGNTTNDTATYFFNKTTPSGVLTCQISKGPVVFKVVTKNITVNPEPTLAEQLEATQCDPAQTFSEDNYINGFSFLQTKLKSVSTGASSSGYSDLTSSSNYDTLFLGDNYQASVECVRTNNNEVIYCSLWIDFDNDGNMAEENEYVGSGVSESQNFTVNNIYIPLDAEPGPKRIRVRVRQTTPFEPTEYCMPDGELSETEDYLVVLSNYDGIQAPNFITPNNDGKNDQFIVRGAKEGANNSLKVFNKIGDLVYDKDNYDNSWTGFDKSGGSLKPGTYYFVFSQMNTNKGKDDVVKGFFEIRY